MIYTLRKKHQGELDKLFSHCNKFQKSWIAETIQHCASDLAHKRWAIPYKGQRCDECLLCKVKRAINILKQFNHKEFQDNCVSANLCIQQLINVVDLYEEIQSFELEEKTK